MVHVGSVRASVLLQDSSRVKMGLKDGLVLFSPCAQLTARPARKHDDADGAPCALKSVKF